MAAAVGKYLRRQVWRQIPGTNALEWVCGPVTPEPKDSDSPTPAQPEKETPHA